jgi:hypothetical protein
MRVFGYSRVSTAEQADEGVSLAAQQQIAGYVMMKGWTVAEHFVERGVSGSLPLADRPEGQRLLATVGKGDVVVVAKLDRAFRSAADASLQNGLGIWPYRRGYGARWRLFWAGGCPHIPSRRDGRPGARVWGVWRDEQMQPLAEGWRAGRLGLITEN